MAELSAVVFELAEMETPPPGPDVPVTEETSVASTWYHEVPLK